jgi:hypothetical protein
VFHWQLNWTAGNKTVGNAVSDSSANSVNVDSSKYQGEQKKQKFTGTRGNTGYVCTIFGSKTSKNLSFKVVIW